ncbi:hypothetical protein BACCIP111895_01921 [Neobacillus rhizosphaerae]|uniref:Uncharacterized protein n=1 Tax=Neobacillus rhizosphaerae TaxID=2880965 RepID=A0ABM9ERE6_9BACI|nr:hypothetical protein [Neobacillus rhizosphaerae]CAH2714745.1 hypothetical protein BACCIP111895_01921 [Neobacillus rhizosphaerae]
MYCVGSCDQKYIEDMVESNRQLYKNLLEQLEKINVDNESLIGKANAVIVNTLLIKDLKGFFPFEDIQ